jgi:hypothetical protein
MASIFKMGEGKLSTTITFTANKLIFKVEATNDVMRREWDAWLDALPDRDGGLGCAALGNTGVYVLATLCNHNSYWRVLLDGNRSVVVLRDLAHRRIDYDGASAAFSFPSLA